MSLNYKKIKNNTSNSMIVNGTYIGPLLETIMSSDVVDLIDKQYFNAGILVDLGEVDVGETVVIDTQTIQFYKKPALGIPKNHLDSEVKGYLDKAVRSVQKGQVELEDLSEKLKSIIQSRSTDVNGDGIDDRSNSLMSGYAGSNSIVIKEKQLDRSIKESLRLAQSAYQKPEEGILLKDLSFEVKQAIENQSNDFNYVYWRDPVTIEELLPLDDNRHGDVRLVIEPTNIFVWDENISKWNMLNFNSGSPSEVVGTNPLITKTVVSELFAEDSQTKFIIEHPFNVGTNQLEVYLNGILVIKDVDYKEVDNHTINFLYPLQEDDYVLASINSGYGGINHNVENIIIGESSNKRIIRSTYVFDPDGTALRVFLNGMLVECGPEGDYVEIDQNHIKFNYELDEDDRITLRVGNSTVSENILNQFATFRKIYTTLSKQVGALQDKVEQMTDTN